MAVIDVFWAFTTAAVALANGASSIVMVRSVEEALPFRDAGIGQICMGEVGGGAPDAFDFGNSPFEIADVDFGGKTIIQRTSAGDTGDCGGWKPSRPTLCILVGQAEATVRALVSGSPRSGFPGCMGTMASAELTRMKCAQSTCGTGLKADWVIQMPFVALS